MVRMYPTLEPYIEGNHELREPQIGGFQAAQNHFAEEGADSEIGIVLPVGCGKTGLISLLPFAVETNRVLVVAPYVKIAQQLHEALNPLSGDRFFYMQRRVLAGRPYPEPVEIRGTGCNRGDLDLADIVITNIDQLQGEENRWLNELPEDYFDLLVFDEGHHGVTRSYEILKASFPAARIVNLSGTPHRADGQLMPGKLIYSYPVRQAIEKGYVKRLKALVLNPATLRYVRHEDGAEMEVPLDEVRRLGEEEAAFRRGIVTSAETLLTVVAASINELRRIRGETDDNRHKIIASALHYGHCNQIVEAYQARGLRAAFVHSRQNAPENERVLEALERHQLDVIVQVRKLGEGFDHPYLSVAAVLSIFQSLSPFVQFVGRIMRAIKPNEPGHAMNQGSVVFHAGAAVARRWADFRDFSDADQEYFDELLPIEGLNFTTAEEIAVEPRSSPPVDEVRGEDNVLIEEVPLLENYAAAEALHTLIEHGYTIEDIAAAYPHADVPTTQISERKARQALLHHEIQRMTGEILARNGANAEGHELDRQFNGRTNFVVVTSRISKIIRERITDKKRHEFGRSELDAALSLLGEIALQVEEEYFSDA